MWTVEEAAAVKKQIRRYPQHIREKYEQWKNIVRSSGLSSAERVAHLTPGKAVRITREFAGLSQIALAARAGLAQGTLSAIESGKATLGAERAKRLALALGVHPAALLFPDWPEPTGNKRR